MFKKLLILLVSIFIFSGLTSIALAAEPEEFVYGRQLMTEQELAEHKAKMRSMKTWEEREAYRLEHHEKMKKRAHERGVKLPDEPVRRGDGMKNRDGSGMGRGSGMGGGQRGM